MSNQSKSTGHEKLPKPLSGIRIIDLTHHVTGPYGTQMFADLGAEVIKVEKPGEGDIHRTLSPFYYDTEGKRKGGSFFRFNRNKKSFTLNLQSPEGKDIFLKLVKIGDVVWENFLPGTMEKLGLGYERLKEVNPKIIYATISGFGHPDVYPGPYWNRPGYDVVAQAMGGAAEVTGEPGGPPIIPGIPIGDLVAGIWCAFGVLAALRMRDMTGLGQRVDLSLYDNMVALCERVMIIYSLTGSIPSRGEVAPVAPWGLYEAKDGHFCIAMVGENRWPAFCKAIGREDLLQDPRLADGHLRKKHEYDVLNPAINEWTRQRTKAEIWEILNKAGVAGGPVQNAKELFDCPQVQARHMLWEFDHPETGKTKVVGHPIKYSLVEENTPSYPPLLGQHNEEILTGHVGYTVEDIERLRREGVI